MNILVTGGAGYVGSHVVRAVAARGHCPTVLDDLSCGHAAAVEKFELVRGDIGDRPLVQDLLRRTGADMVIHMAARALVGESVRQPGRYYEENVRKGLNLLEAMREADCRRIVFSSTAAVYGEPRTTPIAEDHPTLPTNPYGATKLIFESILEGYRRAHGFEATSLRYFNAAGAAAVAGIGEDHDPETHLVPLLMQTALGRRGRLDLYGTDYPTRDGSCVRDYVHVADLADAHLLAADRLAAGRPVAVVNLGTGTGTTVREMVERARQVTGGEIPVDEKPRRPGDPAVLVATGDRARRDLGWEPRRDLTEILRSAWEWHRLHPEGYR